jgi:hypothetical protein
MPLREEEQLAQQHRTGDTQSRDMLGHARRYP